VTAADFNGDGKLDLAVSDLNPLSYPVSILLGNGDGTFQTRKGYPSTGTGTPQVGDINGDGILDLVLANSSGPIVLLGKGDGTFQTGTLFSTLSANSETLADFNGDGRLDLAVGGYGSGQVPILLQTTVALSPSSLNYGSQTVGTSMTMTSMLSNFGPADVTLSKIALSGPNAKDYKTTNTCTTTLAAGSTCTISVIFTPTAKGGRSAMVTITGSAPGSQVLSLFGVGK
jgi:FG-GAP-like repeat/Abnormal spindle-like microcephaly-assoc'd, ASPM-SPD-2-Hydin